MATEAMRVAEIWRYPVKSLQGELLERATLTELGVEGDRSYAIWDVENDLGLTARRAPELLFARATLNEDGSARIVTPDGAHADGDDDLCDWLGRRVELRSGAASGARRYENPADIEVESAASWHVFEGATATFHDSDRARVSLLSLGTLRHRGWDRRRFRANIVLDGEDERALAAERVKLGSAALRVNDPIERCVMVTRPQPDGLGRDLDVMRTIAREEDGTLAVAATVAQGGAVAVGDLLRRPG